MSSPQRDVHASIVQAARQGGAGHKKLRAMASAAFSKYDVDGSGELNDLEVRQVVRDLTGQAPTSEQMHFLTRELDADADSVITRPEFIRWYVKYVIGEQGQVLNRLLVRDQVGHPRPATYKLPPPDKAYGVKYPSDAFGTRDAVTFWNAPQVRKPRTKPPGPDLSNRVFGVVQSRTDAPLKSVMAHAYGSAPAKEDIMPSGTQHTKRVAAKAPPADISAGATLSSALRTAAARERIRAQQSQGPGWKMSKFGKKTTGKLSTHSKNPAASHAAYAEMKRRKAELEAARKKGGMRYVDKVRARHAREAAAAAAQPAPSVHSEEGKSEAYAGGVPDDVPAMDMSSLEHEG